MSQIAELQTECGRFEEASAALAAIDKTISNHYRVWYARGLLHAAQGEYPQAIDDYSKSLELDPEQYWIHKRRGLANFKLKRYEEALSDIAKAVELQPADVSNLTWISPSLTAACPDEDFRQGILKLADKTIELTGGQAEAFVARATILVAMQEFALARADFDLAAKDPKASHSVHYWSALAALAMKDEGGYQQRSAAMIQRYHDSKDPDALSYTAWTSAVAPRAAASYEEPLLLAKRAVELRPLDGEMHRSLGAICYRAGQLEEAQKHLSAATKTPDVNSTSVAYSCYFLAMTNHRLGQNEQAKSWLDKATAYTTKALADDKNDSASPLPWNRRVTLELLDAEAKALLSDAQEKSP